MDSLGLDPNGSAKLNIPKPVKVVKHITKKRKTTPTPRDDGPRRRSGRIAGLEADGEALAIKVEEEEKEREVLRVVARKERGQVMEIKDMLDESDEVEKRELVCPLYLGVADGRMNTLLELRNRNARGDIPNLEDLLKRLMQIWKRKRMWKSGD